ncbi:unnamed protein product [Moneuplotes crassus]|uniref:EF-hand domain-containing protein n=1 Tax=Euplotes crassus TaxID=5936 RepID=A0AAD1UG54_EUPCR|nr:unnamed protein product [Moneuplotes crassus]
MADKIVLNSDLKLPSIPLKLFRNLKNSSTPHSPTSSLSPSPRLKSNSYSTWFKKRCKQTCKEQYLKSEVEIRQNKEIENIFNTFDRDGSGSLDMGEIHELFNSNGIEVSFAQVRQIFEVVDRDGSGSLTREEFVEAAKSEQMRDRFVEVMRRLREERRSQRDKKESDKYIPVRLEDMLQYLSMNIKRSNLLQSISESHMRSGEMCRNKAKMDYNAFLTLFEERKSANMITTKKPSIFRREDQQSLVKFVQILPCFPNLLQ